MDLRKIKAMIDLVAEADIFELEVAEVEGKVRIVKSGAAPQYYPAPDAAGLSLMAVAAPIEVVRHIVKSPMVGTFYHSSDPGDAPFVGIGFAVKEGETLCIIQAMRLCNKIGADASGVIEKILVENGQPVEFGQPLFVVA